MASGPPPLSGNVYAPPKAHVDDVRAEGEYELADRITRLAANIIDGLVYLAAYFPMVFLVLGYSFEELAEQSLIQQLTLQAAGIGLFLLINGYWLATRGQSVGKKLVGVRIVRSDGSPATLGRIVGLRLLPMWIVTLIPIVGMFVAALIDPLLIFRTSRRCLHDDIADTIVIKA